LTDSDSKLTGCMSTVYYGTIGGLGRPRLGVLEPRPVGWGGRVLSYSRVLTSWMVGIEKQRPVPRFAYHAASRAPSQRRRAY